METLYSTVSPESYILPDLLSLSSPFTAMINPHFTKAAAESSAWFSNYDTLRTCCDFVNLTFAIDEISDVQNGEEAELMGEIFLNASRDAEWTDGSALAGMTRDFRARLLRSIGPQSFRRFLKLSEDYIDCVTKEAGYRERSQVLDVESFKHLRRKNSGAPLFLGLLEYTLGIDLPDVVFEDTVFSKINCTAADMVWWANDLYSYNMEQAKGLAGNNILSVLTAANNIDLQTASNHVGDVYAGLMSDFTEAKAELASESFGSKELDAAVKKYVNEMEHWPIGNLEWSFASMRHFGHKGDEIKRTRTVTLKSQEVTT